MLGWERNNDPNTFSLFTHCLLLANWEEKRWRWIDIPKWSFITSLHNLSIITWLSIQKIRTWLFKLKSTNNITHTTTNKYSIISVCKWEEYQSLEDLPTNNLTNNLTNNQQTNNKQITTTKEYKEYKEIKKYIYRFEDFWILYPKKKWKAKAKLRYEEAIRSWYTHEEIIQWLENYRLELKNKWTQEEFIKRPQWRLSEKRRLDDYETEIKKNDFIFL